MKQEIIYPKYLEAVTGAIETHADILKGEGKVSGRKFAQLIRDNFNQADPRNSNAAELAETYIDNIELTEGGTIRWQFS